MGALQRDAQNVPHFIVSVKHTQRGHRYITLWRPDNCGYTWALPNAGRYSREQVMEHLRYYNSGEDLAVPCAVLEAIAVPPVPGHHDNDTGPCIANNRANWNLILANVIAVPTYAAQPAFKGARRPKVQHAAA